jgi:hypothetical protein
MEASVLLLWAVVGPKDRKELPKGEPEGSSERIRERTRCCYINDPSWSARLSLTGRVHFKGHSWGSQMDMEFTVPFLRKVSPSESSILSHLHCSLLFAANTHSHIDAFPRYVAWPGGNISVYCHSNPACLANHITFTPSQFRSPAIVHYFPGVSGPSFARGPAL